MNLALFCELGRISVVGLHDLTNEIATCLHKLIHSSRSICDAAQEGMPQNGLLDHGSDSCQVPLGQSPWARPNAIPKEANWAYRLLRG